MAGMFDQLRAIPRVVLRLATGQVIATREVTINYSMSVLRFTAKRDTTAGEVYAVMGWHASGTHMFAHLDASEVDELANLLRMLQRDVREAKIHA